MQWSLLIHSVRFYFSYQRCRCHSLNTASILFILFYFFLCIFFSFNLTLGVFWIHFSFSWSKTYGCFFFTSAHLFSLIETDAIKVPIITWTFDVYASLCMCYVSFFFLFFLFLFCLFLTCTTQKAHTHMIACYHWSGFLSWCLISLVWSFAWIQQFHTIRGAFELFKNWMK